MRLLNFLNQASGVALLLLVGGGFYFFFLKPSEKTSPAVPGWDDLLPCFDVESLDGTKSIEFSDDHSVTLIDHNQVAGQKVETSKGRWSLIDGEHRRYSIEFAAIYDDYLLVTSPHSEGCMLISGNIQAANLEKSWFSVRVDPADYEEPPDRP